MGMTREEIINEIKPILEELNYPDAVSYLTYNDREWLKENIRILEQEPMTGHWIEERTYMECPNCHDIWYYEENQTERFKFCPTCGERH